jgi:hypothetical protein
MKKQNDKSRIKKSQIPNNKSQTNSNDRNPKFKTRESNPNIFIVLGLKGLCFEHLNLEFRYCL